MFAVIEARKDRAFGNAVANIGAKLDQNARNLEADLGGYARLNGTEFEYLDRHITLDGRDLYLNGAEIYRPRAEQTPAPTATATPVKIRRLEPIDFNQTSPTMSLSTVPQET